MSLDIDLRERFQTYAKAAPGSTGLLAGVLRRSRRRRQRRLVVAGLALVLAASGAVAGPPLLRRAGGEQGPAADQRIAFLDRAYERCLTQKGWEASVRPGGGVSVQSPPVYPLARWAQFWADDQACRAEVSTLSVPMTVPEAEAFVDAVLASYDCVVAAGYRPTPPPSRETMVDETLERGVPRWSPVVQALEAADGGSFERVRDAVDACMPQPPQSYLDRRSYEPWA